MEGFQLNLETAMQFFSVCKELNLNTPEERLALLEAMKKEGSAVKLTHEDIVRRVKGRNVLRIKE